MSRSHLGSLWNRWDLHFHTPRSFDYQGGAVSDESIVESLKGANIRVVAITDHHAMDVTRIRNLQALGGDDLTVLPGMELRSELGGKPVHYILLFSEACDLEHVWSTLEGTLGLTAVGIAAKGGHDKFYVPLAEGAALARQLGGLVSMHAGTKSNTINEISNSTEYLQQFKCDISRDHVDIYEIGRIADVEVHEKTIFPALGKTLPLVICSDNHNSSAYSTKVPLWLKADPTFRGLRMVLREPTSRVFLGDEPPDLQRVRKNPTRYLRCVEFACIGNADPGHKWFQCRVDFNHGLVAIIGNKGSGKSALSDTLGLLGSSRHQASFSFLSRQRFCHSRTGKASQFTASATWESGENVPRKLDDVIALEEVERIKYLPQEHVETVCNELAGEGGGAFERELKTVIFSHVDEADRLGQQTLDDLLNEHTEAKNRRIDSLLATLRQQARSRAALEQKADPASKRDLENQLAERQSALAAHDNLKPAEVEKPATPEGAETAPTPLQTQIAETEKKCDELATAIGAAEKDLVQTKKRHTEATRLLEGLANVEKDVASAKDNLLADANRLGLNIDAIIKLVIDKEPVTTRLREEAEKIKELETTLDGPADLGGLRVQLQGAKTTLLDLQKQLDAPAKKYQKYLNDLKEWESVRKNIVGEESTAGSVKSLEKAILDFGSLPEQIEEAKKEMAATMKSIYAVKVELVEVYRKLYGSVEEFIAKQYENLDAPSLSFRAELACSGFEQQLLDRVTQSRKGTFHGTEEGREKLRQLVVATDWSVYDDVDKFVSGVDLALHQDQRSTPPDEVTLVSQLKKGHTPEDLLTFLYGLEYLSPRYFLKWQEKELSVLSPGERGSVLLIFYLLIDKSEQPLVIDQPEGNLDNHTVAKHLVQCIRQARNRRQVFIVTHNPNLAVVCDADQVIYASIDKEDGNAVTYRSGALENPEMTRHATDVLEGTKEAFDMRGGKYLIADLP